MSQDQTGSVRADPTGEDLLARLTAVEAALKALEHQVRDVDRQPRYRFERSMPAPAQALRGPDDWRIPGLVVEIAA